MALRLGDTAPDFVQESSEGTIHFHEWLGDSWGVLFSHPKDFTPVCTTELGTMAHMMPDFDSRKVKIVVLSADPVDRHTPCANDVPVTPGTAVNSPLTRPSDRPVSRRLFVAPKRVHMPPEPSVCKQYGRPGG